MKCIDCALFSHYQCRLKYKNPVTGEPIASPLTAYEARSYCWSCGPSAAFGCTCHSPLYETIFGVFTEEQCLAAFESQRLRELH